MTLITLVALTCWILPARSSLWLDETGTYWIVKDGFRELLDRAAFWTGCGYYPLAWIAVKLGGANELVMRVPSLLAMACSTWLMYLIGLRLFDRGTGLVAALVFASMRVPVFAAADARPYALANLVLIADVLVLLRWLDTGRRLYATAYVVLAALTAYMHVLFTAGLIVPALWALWRRKQPGAMAAMWIAVISLCIPLGVSAVRSSHHEPHSWAETPGAHDLLAILSPSTLVTSLAAGLFLAYLLHPAITARWTHSKAAVLLIVPWFAFTPVLFFAISRMTEMKILIPRYVLSSAPGMALLVACIIRSFQPALVQRVMAATLALLTIVAFGLGEKFKHTEQDWRGAMAAVRSAAEGPNSLVLVQSGFVEATDPDRLMDPKLKEVLFAPLVRYPAAGQVMGLPYQLNEPFLEDLVQRVIAGRDSFLLVSDARVEWWLRARLADRRPAIESLGPFGSISLVRFRLH